MKRAGRLSNAKNTEWVKQYSGKNIIKGYRKWYAVDEMTALIELRLLGVSITKEREEQIKITIEQRAKKRTERKVRLADENVKHESEWEFIADYTAGGTPYGIKSSSDLDS